MTKATAAEQKDFASQRRGLPSGFAVEITDATDLGLAMLISEDDAGGYFPLGPVSTMAEGREVARRDLRSRMRQLEQNGEPFCPATYKVWARGLDGVYAAATFDPSEL
jgi:hypothetical protein